MCKDTFALEQTAPINATGPQIGYTPGQGTTVDPQTGLRAPNPGQITDLGGSAQTQIGTQKTPTKLGTLLKFLAPAIQGGLIGWAGGKAAPGGGWNAAQNFFDRRRQNLMQMALFQQQLRNEAIQNAQRLAEANYYARGGPVRQSQPVIGKNGNYWSLNPVTRQLEDTGVPAQQKTNTKLDQTELTTDANGNAVVVDRTKGTARPVTMENSGGNATDESQTGLPEGTPIAADIIRRNAGIPRTPPSAPSPSAVKMSGGMLLSLAPKGSATSRLEDAAVADIRKKHPGWDDAQVLSAVSKLRSTKTESDGTPTPTELQKTRAQILTLQNRELAEAGAAHTRELEKDDAPFRLDEINQAFQGQVDAIKQRYRDFAATMGVDLDNPPTAQRNASRRQAKPPAGATMRVPGSDGKMHWSDGKRDLGVIQ